MKKRIHTKKNDFQLKLIRTKKTRAKILYKNQNYKDL